MIFPALPAGTTGPAYRLALSTDPLCAALAARMARYPYLAPLLTLAWHWIRRTTRRFARIVERLERGEPDPVRPSRAGIARTPPARRPLRLPNAFAWLRHYVPLCGAYGSQIEHLLKTDAEFAAAVRASPQARRLLRPMLKALGVRIGPELKPLLSEPPKPKLAPPDFAPSPKAPVDPPSAQSDAETVIVGAPPPPSSKAA